MLRTVVLPAPLGPMTDRISPRRTSRLTRITACTPPNALDTPPISSCELMVGGAPPSLALPSAYGHAGPIRGDFVGSGSRQPALAALVVLHVAVALALAHAGQPQVELLDVLVVADGLPVAVQHDAAVLHDVGVLGDPQRHRGVLFSQQDRHVLLAVQPAHDLEDLRDQHGRQPHGGLVEQHELGVGHERARSEEHTSDSSHGSISYAVFCLKKKKADAERDVHFYNKLTIRADGRLC